MKSSEPGSPPTRSSAFKPPAVRPGPAAPGPYALFAALVRDPLSAIPPQAYEEPFAFIEVMGQTVVMVMHPPFIEEMLVKRPGDFPKSRIDNRIFSPILGRGLLTAEGDDWKWKRRLAAPTFAPSCLARACPGIVAPFTALARTWIDHSVFSGTPVDIGATMTEATLDVIAGTLFSGDDGIDLSELSSRIDDYLEPIAWQVGMSTLRLPGWLPHPGRGKMNRARRRLRRSIAGLIRERRAKKAAPADFCSDLMKAVDPETERTLSDSDLIDMLLTLVAAGHETSANALTWALYCLASQPELQTLLTAEISAVTGGGTPEYGHVDKFVHTDAFLRETMRLFPPAPLLARELAGPEMIFDRKLPAGTTIFIPIYALHRNRRIWQAPETFRIDRFLAGRKPPARTAYLPFGAGPRICVGGAFAMLEMKLALAELLRTVRVRLAPQTVCEPVHRVTLRPRQPLCLFVDAA